MSKVRLFIAGDFCSKPPARAISVADELRALIKGCDYGVVNFEVPLRPDGAALPPQGRERFWQNDDVPDFLCGVGFNLFQLANNHVFDWGEAGYRKTRAALGDAAFGAGTYDEAYSLKVVEKEGVRIGLMALTFAAYRGVFDDVTRREGLGCAYINDLRVNHDIVEAKKRVDYLFVLPHDGIEYIDVPMPETVARYRDFVDWGADGVFGTHPHCPQGWEEYRGKPIFYSLGNLLFNSKEGYDYRATNRPHWYDGLCVVLEVDGHGVTWEVVNTVNEGNTGIGINRTDEIKAHNARVCALLRDGARYSEALGRECVRLTEGQEFPILERSFRLTGRKLARLAARYLRERMGLRHAVRNDELEYLLKNSTRVGLLRRGMCG